MGVTIGNHAFHPSQGNNMYIFPAIGLGASIAGAKYISEEVFYEASKALASCVTEDQLQQSIVYPPVEDIKQVTARVAVEVVRTIIKEGHARNITDADREDLTAFVKSRMWDSDYVPVVPVRS